MYRTAPQIIFQFVGGFATAQYTYPILFNSFQRSAGASSTGSGTSSSLSGGGISIPYADSISNAWGKVKNSVPLDRFTTPRSLSEDVEALLLSYRTLSVIVLSLVVTSGGAPALIGAGLSLYCDGGPEGRARYAALKKKWHELNNS